MFDELKLIEIGHIIRSHGVRGEVKISINKQIKSEITGKNKKLPVFILFSGLPVPFFIESVKTTGSNYIVKFFYIDTPEQAEDICSRAIFSASKNIKSNTGCYEQKSINSYKVFSDKHGFIGTISQINEIPGNPLIEIKNDKNTFLVPYVKEFIEKIDHKKKEIKINPPEGLIELYL